MTDARPTAPELAARLRQTYAGLHAAVTEVAEKPDSGGWTSRQVLAHVAFWDRYQTDRLQRALAGESAPTELDEQANAALENDARAATEGRTDAVVIAESSAARDKLVEFVESLSEAELHEPYAEGDWPLSLVQLIHQVGIWHVRAHTASLPGGTAYAGNSRDLD
jgi:uncharacterized damage-inducible protein DinB